MKINNTIIYNRKTSDLLNILKKMMVKEPCKCIVKGKIVELSKNDVVIPSVYFLATELKTSSPTARKHLDLLVKIGAIKERMDCVFSITTEA